MKLSEERVRTGDAAKISGWGFEGLRTQLKKGLLGRVGLLPGFHAPNSDTSDDPTPRTKWSQFSFGSLCLMRMAKVLIENGMSAEGARQMSRVNKIWQRIERDQLEAEMGNSVEDWYIVVDIKIKSYSIFSQNDINKSFCNDIRNSTSITVLNMGALRREVSEKMLLVLSE